MQVLSKKTMGVALATSVALCGLLPILQATAGEVTGKVVAVFHELETVAPRTFDKISVTVKDCATSQLVTSHYALGSLADDNALGYLFRDDSNAARANVTKSQYMTMINGHATLKFDDKTHVIEKTTLWGNNWECGKNVGAQASGVTAAAPAAGSGTTAATTAAPQAGVAGSLGRLGRLGR